MALQNFVDFVGPAVSAAWLNAVDKLKVTVFGDAVTKASARANLTQDLPLEIANGGTGVRTLEDLIAEVGGGGGGGGGGGADLPAQAAARLKVLQSDGTAALWAGKGYTYVNDFYPIGVNAHDGTSHPLSTFFSTLAEAQAYYPHATALTDEFDWCAIQGASNYIYNRDLGAYPNYNFSTAQFLLDGQYVLNKTVVFNHVGVKISGTAAGTSAFRGNTYIRYNGPDGTLDDPIPLFDFYVYDEFNQPPPGRFGNPAAGGIRVIIEHITFTGKATSTAGFVQGFSKYISAIRFRQAVFCQVSNCSFQAWLYDGIYCTGPQLFLIIDRNFFYGIERDAIAVWPYRGNFSTTIWIYNNEFGYVTRYSILLDLSGSVEAMPIIRDNSFEAAQTTSSWYLQHPEWCVQGVTAEVCLISCGNAIWSSNRGEVGLPHWDEYYWGHLHIAYGLFSTIENSLGGKVVFTGARNTVQRTPQAKAMWGNAPLWAALTAYTSSLTGENYVTPAVLNGYYYQCTVAGTSGASAPVWPTTIGTTVTDGTVTWTCKGTVKKYHDFTDARNYHIGFTGDVSNSLLPQHITLRKWYNCHVYLCEGLIGTSGQHAIQDMTTGISFMNFSSVDGTYIRMAEPKVTAKPVLIDVPNTFNITNSSVTRPNGLRYYGHFYRTQGSFYPITTAAAWTPSTAYLATITGQSVGLYRPTVENGFQYRPTVSGTSGTIEPTWPVIVGNTVVDGTVTWTCVGRNYYATDVNQARRLFGSIEEVAAFNTTPTTGYWDVGAIAYNNNPTATAPDRWVCTVAGTPGTWLPVYVTPAFGGIYVNNGVTAQAIATGATPTLLTAFNTVQGFQGLFSNTTPNKALSKITIARAGKYRVSWDMSASCDVTGALWSFYVFNGGVQATNTGLVEKFGTAGEIEALGGTAFIQVAASTDIDLRGFHGDAGTVNLTPVQVNLNVEWLSD